MAGLVASKELEAGVKSFNRAVNKYLVVVGSERQANELANSDPEWKQHLVERRSEEAAATKELRDRGNSLSDLMRSELRQSEQVVTTTGVQTGRLAGSGVSTAGV